MIICLNHPHASKVQNDPAYTYAPGSARPSCPSWIALRESAMGREIWANAGLRLWLRLRQQVRVLKCSLWLSDYQVWYPRSTCGRWNGLQGSRMFWPLPNWWKLCCNCWSSTNIGFRVTEHRATLWKIGHWLFCLDLLAVIVWWFTCWSRLGWSGSWSGWARCADHRRPRLDGHQWVWEFWIRSRFCFCNKKKQVSSVSSPGFNQLDNLRPLSAASIAVLAFNGGFAYDGWNQLNFITEEIKDPMKNLPRLVLMKNNSKLNDLSGEKHFYYLFCWLTCWSPPSGQSSLVCHWSCSSTYWLPSHTLPCFPLPAMIGATPDKLPRYL